MKNTIFAVLFVCLGVSCGFTPEGGAVNTYRHVIANVKIEINVARGYLQLGDEIRADGVAQQLGDTCVIWLSQHAFEVGQHRVFETLAHEFGHCVDHQWANFTHNAFEDEGRFYGAYFEDPAEGFAETWARLYMRDCEEAGVEGLGLTHGTPPICDSMPTLEQVTPRAVYSLGRV